MAQNAGHDPRYRPDRVVAYSMADTRASGNQILADGAAFRSDGHWYNLKFTCRATRNLKEIMAFEYAVGDAIARKEWSAHGLAPIH